MYYVLTWVERKHTLPEGEKMARSKIFADSPSIFRIKRLSCGSCLSLLTFIYGKIAAGFILRKVSGSGSRDMHTAIKGFGRVARQSRNFLPSTLPKWLLKNTGFLP